MSTQATFLSIIAIGCGATVVMDAWLAILRRIGVQTLNFALIGRWAAYAVQGRFTHASIAKTEPVKGELALGWMVHYIVGIVFAGLLATITGPAWLQSPTFAPAVLFGIASASAPLLIMQPAMGLGFLASKTPRPLPNCLRSVANHTIFGAGLFITAWFLSRVAS